MTIRAQWLLAALQLASWGSLFYAFAALARPMEQSLGWSRDEIMAAMSVSLAVAAIVATVVGGLIDQGRARWVLSAGSLIGGLMLLAWATTSSRFVFYLAAAGIGAAQAMTLYDAGFALLNRRLGVGAAPALLRLTLVGGFAGTIFVPATSVLAAWAGWRAALLSLAALNLLVCAPLHALSLKDDTVAKSLEHNAQSPPDFLRSATFWRLVVTFAAWSLVFGGLTFHLLPLLSERGISEPFALILFATIGPLQCLGRFALLAFHRALEPIGLGRLLTATLALAIGLLIVSRSHFLGIAAAIALYGLANGMITVLRGIAVGALLGRSGYGVKTGAIATASGLSQACAPYVVSVLWTIGGYDLAGAVLLGSATAGAITFWSIRPSAARHQPVEEDVEKVFGNL